MKTSLISSLIGILAFTAGASATAADFHTTGKCDGDSMGSYDINLETCLRRKGMDFSDKKPGGVWIHADSNIVRNYCLVMSNDEDCRCQNHGMQFTASGQCQWFDPEWDFKSYRFVQGKCNPDNCPKPAKGDDKGK